jgi:hypothetical protein
MPQKLVTITVRLGEPGVQEHLADYLGQGWRVVSLSVGAAGAAHEPVNRQAPPRPGHEPANPAVRAAAALVACVAVLLERADP